MFILRTFNERHIEQNEELGDNYSFIEKEGNKKEFIELLNSFVMDEEQKEKVYAFILYNDGAGTLPLYVGHLYFIMTESGKTFANISQR